jgi:4-amino-4-deoxy-L-arabinose transferase-like glycosyltransferase
VNNALNPENSQREQRERQKSWLTLGLLWALLLVLAALRPLAVPDEGRYGEVGRWMLQSGDWLTPRLNGIPFFHKPPLLYWLQAMSLATFGVNAWALRLVPALHAGLMLAALYLAGRTVATEQIARRAAIMLGTSLTVLVGGQYINHDMLVATWIGVAIWCFAFSFMAGERPHAGLARWGFVACALGMLSKGLIGFALPGLVLFVWLLWTRQFRKVLHLPWLSGLALFAAIVVPWFAMAQHKYPEFLDYMFVRHQFQRYTATTFNNPQPWWLYLLAIGLLFFPWVLFALAQVRKPARLVLSHGAVAREWTSLCWIWVIAITVFFSIPNSKLVGYILPVIPALALLAALGWERVMAHRAYAGKLFAALCVLNTGIATAIVLSVGGVTAKSRAQDISQVLACQARPGDTVYTLGGYPYDLPFYAQLPKPMVALNDWDYQRANARDGWERELFEGADFDAEAAKVLQPASVLVAAGKVSGNWLVTQKSQTVDAPLSGWTLVNADIGWRLYKSGPVSLSATEPGLSAPESPKPAQQKGLPGCKH